LVAVASRAVAGMAAVDAPAKGMGGWTKPAWADAPAAAFSISVASVGGEVA
jgi:hypothetical protein